MTTDETTTPEVKETPTTAPAPEVKETPAIEEETTEAKESE